MHLVPDELTSSNIPASNEAVYLTRAPIRRGGISVLDVTIKSALGYARHFAPSWDMVQAHKRRRLSDDAYRELYRARLDAVPDAVWEWFWRRGCETQGLLVLGCYCPDGVFCHTHCLIEYSCQRFPHWFRDGRVGETLSGAQLFDGDGEETDAI